jgi:uncharacterized OsmC-like protein
VVSTLRLTYDSDQHVTALKMPEHNVVEIDCPFTGKGDEFSPASLLGISLASCMLLSMGAIARRDHLDITGSVVDVKLTGMDKTFPHVDTITVTFDIPRSFPQPDRDKLERSAGLCPIMGCLGSDISISVKYRYAEAEAA